MSSRFQSRIITCKLNHLSGRKPFSFDHSSRVKRGSDTFCRGISCRFFFLETGKRWYDTTNRTEAPRHRRQFCNNSTDPVVHYLAFSMIQQSILPRDVPRWSGGNDKSVTLLQYRHPILAVRVLLESLALVCLEAPFILVSCRSRNVDTGANQCCEMQFAGCRLEYF
jgi:hypothetical protein